MSRARRRVSLSGLLLVVVVLVGLFLLLAPTQVQPVAWTPPPAPWPPRPIMQWWMPRANG